ncbi:class I SAM-dependent methyltransferase [Metabacillus herbersteinensis]|uniref:Class I SAM-dependent methyltransferase n=1 Tax=Metabacillus herbersteinensis TaxID=283816 RepID=A0ABV6GLA2_9BACI
MSDYLRLLSLLGIGGAHPGGLMLTKAIYEQESYPEHSSILDVGCGTGQTTSFLKQLGYNVKGIDIDRTMIAKAIQRNKKRQFDIAYMNCSVESTPFSSDEFDVILSESVLSFTSIESSLSEIHRILKEYGILIAIEIITTQSLTDDEEQEILQFYGFSQVLSEKEWVTLFTQSGFSSVQIFDQNDFDLALDEPTTEFDVSSSISQSDYEMLTAHEELTEKYKNKLSYKVFRVIKG